MIKTQSNIPVIKQKKPTFPLLARIFDSGLEMAKWILE